VSIALACLAAFFAGLVDAMAGGGGLIQVPAVFALMPDAPVATVLGTNKGAAFWGTAAAAIRYARSVPLPWRSVGLAAGAAGVASAAGAMLARGLDASVLRPAILVALVLVAGFTFLRPDFGKLAGGVERPWLATALGAAIGLYDGMIGPGTGTFLIVAFIATLGLDFLGAGAGAKVVNATTNLAAILVFAWGGNIRWDWSIPMAVSSVAGNLIGARIALARGSGWVRTVFLVVSVALVGKLALDVYGS